MNDAIPIMGVRFFDWVIAHWPSAAAWTAIATLLLAYIVYLQLRWNREQARSTGIAALAAERSANVLAESERPYLAVGSGNMQIIDWDHPGKRSVKFLVNNFGRLPARLSWWTICPKVDSGLDLPGPPDYPTPFRHFGVVVPNGAIEIWASGPMLKLGYPDETRYTQGDHLFLYGFIEYQSLDRTLSYAPFQFCFRFARDENQFVIAGDQTYWEGKHQYQPPDNTPPPPRSVVSSTNG